MTASGVFGGATRERLDALLAADWADPHST
jgi:hypothetical protein